MSNTSSILSLDTKVTDKRFMNTKEVAAYLGVSRWMINRMTQLPNPELPFVPFGRTKRFDKLVVDKTIEDRTIRARSYK